MVQHMVTPAPSPSALNPAAELPPELDDLILHCLKKDPIERPESIQDVAHRLHDILERCRPLPGGDGRRVRLVRGKNNSRLGPMRAAASATGGVLRRRWPIALVVAVALSMLIAAGLLAWSHENRRKIRGASVRPSASPPPISPAPAPMVKDPPPASAQAPRLTVEPPVGATAPEAPATTAVVRPSTTQAPRAAHPQRAAGPSRRKPAKLDWNGVVNPFE
jgi:serine/threonine protein kinase